MPVDADQKRPAPASVVSPSAMRWLVPTGVIVLFLIAMLAAAVAGRPTFSPPGSAPEPLPQPTAQQTLPPVEMGQPPEQGGDDTLLIIIGILMLTLVVTAVIAALVLVIRALQRRWRSRALRQQDGSATDVEVQADVVAESAPDAPAMLRGIAAARASISSHHEPSDAIVAAWIGLEETAVDSGVGRGRSETPAEFTLRVLLHRPRLEDPARRLLRLYESVRFGGRIADESMRADAARALSQIEEGWR